MAASSYPDDHEADGAQPRPGTRATAPLGGQAARHVIEQGRVVPDAQRRRFARRLRILLPAAVVGELLYASSMARGYRQNLDQLERFLGKPVVDFVPVTLRTCHHFGSVAAALRRAGTPIPVNDVWGAAHALRTDASLLTHDAHFRWIPGLSIVHPA